MDHRRTAKHSRGGAIFSSTPTKETIYKSILKSPTKRSHSPRKSHKTIRVNTAKNTTQVFKQESPVSSIESPPTDPVYPHCLEEKDTYPCRYNETVFENQAEYDEYIALRKTRNLSTNHRSRREHYSHTRETLKKKHAYAKKVPAKYRRQDPRTGKIYDTREPLSRKIRATLVNPYRTHTPRR